MHGTVKIRVKGLFLAIKSMENHPQSLHKKFLYLGGISLAGAFLVNVLNYFFTLVTGRMLGPSLFAEVATITGFFLLIIVPSSALTLYVAKEIAVFNSEGHISNQRAFFRRSTKQGIYAGLIGFVIFTLCVPALSLYLKIDYLKLLLFGLVIPVNFLVAVTNGMFQGRESFGVLAVANILSSALKFVLAIIAIKMGLAVIGVILSLILSSVITYVFSLINLNRALPLGGAAIDEDASLFRLREFMYDYNFIFWTTLGLALLFNMDVILAKHYLTPVDAGHYAALSILSKIILYASMSLISVMFPLISSSKGKGRKTVLNMSLFIITAIAVAVLGVVQLFPKLWVGILFGAAYDSIIPFLTTVGIAMYFLSLVYCLVNYFVAIKRTKVVLPLMLGVVLQVMLLMYSPHTLAGFSKGLILGELGVLAIVTCFYCFSGRDALPAKENVNISDVTNKI